MTNPAPWSIKGVDKETREKMKQMAMAKGMTLADFLDEMLSTSAKLIDKKMSNFSEKSDDFIKNKEHTSQANDMNQKNMLENQLEPKNKPSQISENSNSVVNHQPKKPEIFNQLVKKISGDTPLISEELSHNDINETIMRERHMRDLVRVQMTEMREILVNSLEQRIDEKMSKFMNNVVSSMINVTDETSGITIDTNIFLKKEDLHEHFERFGQFIDSKIENNIKNEISSYSDTMNNIVEVISEDISRIGDILENKYLDIQKMVQNIPQNKSSDDYNDQNMSSMLQENFDLLLNRIKQIEDNCIVLDHKLSDIQMNTHDSDYQDTTVQTNQIQPLKEEIEKYFELNLQYIDKAVSSLQTNENPQITKSLQAVSNRLIHLEKMLQNFEAQPNTKSHEENEELELQNEMLTTLSNSATSSKYMEEDHDFLTLSQDTDFMQVNQIKENSKKEADWDDSHHIEDEDLLEEISPEELMDIRSQDQKMMFKSLRDNINEKSSSTKIDDTDDIPDATAQVARIRNMVFMGGFSFIIIALLWLLLT